MKKFVQIYKNIDYIDLFAFCRYTLTYFVKNLIKFAMNFPGLALSFGPFKRSRARIGSKERVLFIYPAYMGDTLILTPAHRSFFQSNGIITSGLPSIDIYFWVMFIITLRIGEIERNHQAA